MAMAGGATGTSERRLDADSSAGLASEMELAAATTSLGISGATAEGGATVDILRLEAKRAMDVSACLQADVSRQKLGQAAA